MSSRSPELAEPAVFVDLDGTLVEIVAQPHLVQVPHWLPPLLSDAAARLDGALALISGRPIRELDEILNVSHLAAAGLHGLESRRSDGSITRSPTPAIPDWVRRDLDELCGPRPGLLLEDKTQSIAVHFRQAPDQVDRVRENLVRICEDLGEAFVLQPGKMVCELRPRGTNKGTAIRDFMRAPPFAGRVPVFIGDDVTDEDGFGVVNSLGGYSVRVGNDGYSTLARYSLRNVDAVHDWLDCLDCGLL